MKKVIITGAKGIVGGFLFEKLKRNYNLFLADLPEYDLRDYDVVLELTKKQDRIIHLAWNTKKEDGNARQRDKGNTKMWINVYEAALVNNVSRVVMASSIHATSYASLNRKIVTADMEANSETVYGRHKRYLERKGEEYAKKGLEVVCVRLGGICREDEKPQPEFKRDGITPKDLTDLFKVCLEAESIPGNYLIVYGLSKNGRETFDLSNPLGWQPEQDAADFYGLS